MYAILFCITHSCDARVRLLCRARGYYPYSPDKGGLAGL